LKQTKINLDEIQNLYAKQEYALALRKVEKFLKKNKNDPNLLNYKAILLTSLNRFDDSITILNKVLSQYPNSYQTLLNLGMTMQKKNNLEKAADYYIKAHEVDPNAIESYLNLSSMYLDNDKNEKAIFYLEQLIKTNTNLEYAQHLLAEANIRSLNFDRALDIHKLCIQRNPFNPQNYFLLGVDYIWAGKKREAKENLLEAIKMNSTYAEAYHALVRILDSSDYDFFIDKLENLLKDYKFSDRDLVFIYFSLFNLYDKSKNYILATKYLLKANEIRNNSSPYNFDNEINFNQQIKKVYEKIKKLKPNNIVGKDIIPIFIVGLPRSGTSLIEQVISNNDEIFAAGEINTLHENLKKIIYADDLEQSLSRLSNIYLNKIIGFSDKKYIVDKLPLNFYWIGFIRYIFPNAKIIHINRNPIDVCFSIYKNLFVEGALEFSYCQKKIISFYNFYKDMMKFWKTNESEFFYTLNYEEFVNDPKENCIKLYQYLGLNFDEKYLNIQKNSRWVRTASDIQVRDKINKESIESWHNYKEALSDLIIGLNHNF